MPPEAPVRPPWVRALGLAALSVTLAVVVWWPMVQAYPHTQDGDGEYFHRIIEAGKISLTRYHELPLWNPFDCGGVPLWDNPQSVGGSPLMLLLTPLDTDHTLWVWYWWHAAAGFVGTWLLARHELGVSRAGAFVASCLFGFAVSHSGQYSGGHDALAPFLYAPFAVFFWRRAETSLNMAVLLGLVFALMFQEGATYPIPLLALVLGAETLTRAYPPRRLLAIAKAGAVAGVVTLFVGASRLLPVADQLTHHKRPMPPETDSLADLHFLREMYFDRHREWFARLPGHGYNWSEYASYTGGVVLVLALIGVLFAGRARLWLLFVTLFTFVLMLGPFTEHAPFRLLNLHVFPFTSMRVSARFRLILILPIAVYVGIAVDRAPGIVGRLLGRRLVGPARVALVGLGFLGAGDVMSMSSDVIATRFLARPTSVVVPSPHLYFGGTAGVPPIDQVRLNHATVACVDPWNFYPNAPVWEGDVVPARSADASVVILGASRTQNKFFIDVDAKAPGRVLVNSPYDRGWRSNVGKVDNANNLLVVDVPAGQHHLTVSYWPHGLTAGFFMTAAGLVLVGLFFARDRLRARFPRFAGARAA